MNCTLKKSYFSLQGLNVNVVCHLRMKFNLQKIDSTMSHKNDDEIIQVHIIVNYYRSGGTFYHKCNTSGQSVSPKTLLSVK